MPAEIGIASSGSNRTGISSSCFVSGVLLANSTEHITPDDLAGCRHAQLWPNMSSGKIPPGHYLCFMANDCVNIDPAV